VSWAKKCTTPANKPAPTPADDQNGVLYDGSYEYL
jgi:hypothetical protein